MDPGFTKNFLVKSQYYVSPCIVLLLLATSCSQPINQMESYRNGSTVPLISTTQIVDRTKAVVATQTMTVSPTHTRAPTLRPTFTRTSTPSPVFTLTPVPRLSPDEAMDTILSMYSDNGGCDLPCWWGITPGETSWAQTHSRLSPLGDLISTEVSSGVTRYDFQFVVPESIDPLGYFWPAILVEHDLVKAVNINTRWIMRDFDYSLAGLLKTFGQPEEIWVQIYPGTVATSPHYDMVLYYPGLGVDIGLVGKAARAGNILTICPQNIFSLSEFAPGILMWSPADKIAFKDMGQSYLSGLGSFKQKDYHLLENFTNEFDEKTFYETYNDPKTNRCIQIDLLKSKDYLAYPPS